MPKSNKDIATTIGSLRPDDSNYKNASVREMEQRWPLLKTMHPQKLEQTPVLSEEERQHWIGSPKTSVKKNRQILSMPSATSSIKLAESLKKMAGLKTKLKTSSVQSKSLSDAVQGNILIANQIKSNTETKKPEELNKTALSQIKQSVKVEKDIEDKKDVKAPRSILPTKSSKDKNVITPMPSDSVTLVDEVKTLRGIFGRLSEKKVEPVLVSPVKSSVLKKLSKK